MDRTLQTVRKYIIRHNLLNKEQSVIVGVSGGADSVFLLRCLLSMGYNCDAVHCNFHLRGEESMRDEQFVRELCEKLGVSLIVKDFDTAEYASTNKMSIELAARELRYGYFEQIRSDLHAQAIAVAHHRDDNVETFIWNMVRGTGIRGLRGMLPKNGNVVRPLLCISRQDILDELDTMNQEFVTDSSNLKDDVTRNKIRLNILPLLKDLNNGADSNISTMMENMQEIWNIYTDYIETALSKSVKANSSVSTKDKGESDGFIIDISKLNDCTSVISVIHEALSPLCFSRSQIENMLTADSGKEFLSSAHPDGSVSTVKVKVNAEGNRKLIVTP